ncbi:MAG: VOC family protein [Cyclobacteriaceae bacterium]|nr:VOC family protein [Cyclobacteriaceae bacterium]
MSRNSPTITPGLLYHNASEMIEWLCLTFGFHKKLVIPDNNGKILHAHLVFNNGGIMLSSAENYNHPHLCKSPKQTGASTVEIIVVVNNIDEHYNFAKRNGANIVIPLEDKPYGGKGYSAKDPEGYTWAFGSYDPWKKTNF